jgi:RNA binding exosome subunit
MLEYPREDRAWEDAMRSVSAKVTKEESEKAVRVLARQTLPKDVTGYAVEPGEDHYGNPVLWVWLDVTDPNRTDRDRVVLISDFIKQVRHELYQELEEYSPHVTIRAA